MEAAVGIESLLGVVFRLPAGIFHTACLPDTVNKAVQGLGIFFLSVVLLGELGKVGKEVGLSGRVAVLQVMEGRQCEFALLEIVSVAFSTVGVGFYIQ